MSSRTTFKSDKIYRGKVNYARYNKRKGILCSDIIVHEFGAIAALDRNSIFLSATTAGAGYLTLDGALVAAGVATFTTPRGVTLYSAGDDSGDTLTITGTDVYGEVLVENITGPNAGSTYGKKAFATVTSVYTDGALSQALEVGTGNNVIGLPFRLASKGKMIGATLDGKVSVLNTIVPGLAASGTSTATSADIRGSVQLVSAPDGAKIYTIMYIPDGNSVKENVFGAAQYAG